MRRCAGTLLAAVLVAGCGSSDKPVATTAGALPGGPPRLLYTGATSQRQSVSIEATPKLFGTIKLQLSCKDGSDTRVTMSTSPGRPTLEPDGSFYYQEAGRTRSREFPGFGAGRYRGAMQGDIIGTKGSGHAAFRISFKDTSCRAAVRWNVARGG